MPHHSTTDFFVWNVRFETGIAEIDAQHRRLMQLVNILAGLQANRANRDELLAVFDELADYTVFHFGTEEALMQDYPVDHGFEDTHLRAHANFIKQVSDAREAADDDPGEVIGRVLGFLCRWLIFHILGTDMRMAKEILALQAGVSPEEARLQAADHMKGANEVLLEAMDVLYANLADRTHDFWQANHRLHVEIDEHQKTMRELRKLSRAVEGSPVPVMMTDTEGRIEYVNEKFCQVNGYSPAEVLGRMPSILKSGTMPDEVYRALWQAVADGGEWFGEMQNRRKDGSLYWARMSVSPLTSVDGEITHYLAFSEDISAQKQVEEEIRHANAHLEASNAELQRQTRDLTLLNRMNETRVQVRSATLMSV